MEEKPELDRALQALQDRLEVLGGKATELCQQHFDLITTENKVRAWEGKSVLFAQTRVRGFSLTTNWYEIRWYGSKAAKTRRMVKKLINRQRGEHGYNMAVLHKLSQPWESNIVETIEPQLKEIRREVWLISKAIVQLKLARKGGAK